jgi:hypothetical protein
MKALRPTSGGTALPFPALSTIRCSRCRHLGVTVVAIGRDTADYLCWCKPRCAKRDGWPFLPKRPPDAPVKRRKSDEYTRKRLLLSHAYR